MSEYLAIKNWSQYQHYKHRNTPWIKLHTSLFASEDWVMLTDAGKLTMVACMVIAAQHEGRIPNNPDYIQRVAHLEKKPDLKSLIRCGFLIKAQANASKSKQLRTDKIQIKDKVETEDKGPGADPQQTFFAAEEVKLKAAKTRSENQSIKLCLEIWNEVLGESLHNITTMTEQRRKHLKSRVKGQMGGSLRQWRAYCERIKASDFLSGRTERNEEHKNWKPDFSWAVNLENCVKLLEGKYDNKGQDGGEGNPLGDFERAHIAWQQGGRKGPEPKISDFQEGDK